jgi:hypothetical protein
VAIDQDGPASVDQVLAIDQADRELVDPAPVDPAAETDLDVLELVNQVRADPVAVIDRDGRASADPVTEI